MNIAAVITLFFGQFSYAISAHPLLDNLQEKKNIVPIVDAYYSTDISNVIRCKKLCEYQQFCFLATFQVKSRRCFLYDKRSVPSKVVIDPGWILFNNSNGREISENSCSQETDHAITNFNFPAPGKCISIEIDTNLKPFDCHDVHAQGGLISGVYTVFPYGDQEGISVFCDQTTDGGGWLLFQRRMDGSEDFFRTWTEYEDGFGDTKKEFWLGNRIISNITAKRNYELRVDLEDFENETRYATYSTFSLGDALTNYTLTVSGYSGNAGDSLTYHSGWNFATKDRDFTRRECTKYKGGFWYGDCHRANVNGLYLRGNTTIYGEGIVWLTWKGYLYSLKRTELKIRPNSNT